MFKFDVNIIYVFVIVWKNFDKVKHLQLNEINTKS